MKRKFLRTLVALTLVFSLGAITAAPVSAANPVIQVVSLNDGDDLAARTALTKGDLDAEQSVNTAAVSADVITGESTVAVQTSNGDGGDNGVLELDEVGTLDIDIDHDGSADTVNWKATANATGSEIVQLSFDTTYGSGNLTDGILAVDNDEEIGPAAGMGFTTDGKDFLAVFEAGGADVSITPVTLYSGTLSYDLNADGTADTIQVILVDATGSDGVYDTLDFATNNDNIVDAQDVTTGDTTLGTNTHDLQLTTSNHPMDPAVTEDVKIQVYTYTKSTLSTGDLTIDLRAKDAEADGILETLEIDDGDGNFNEGTLNDGIVAANNDEKVTISSGFLNITGSTDTAKYYFINTAVMDDPTAAGAVSFELGFKFNFAGTMISVYVEDWEGKARIDFNNDGDFADPGETDQYAETEYLTDTKTLAGSPVSYLTEDYYVLLCNSTNALQIMPVPRAGYTYDLKVNYSAGASNPVYLEDVGVESVAPADAVADNISSWDPASTTMITLNTAGTGTFYSVYFSAATDVNWTDADIIALDTAPAGSGTDVGKFEVQPSDYADVVVAVDTAEFTYNSELSFTVTVTKGGSPLENALVQIIQDDDGDGNLDSGTTTLASDNTLADGTKEFTVTPSAAGVMVMKVTKDIGGTEVTGVPDGINDIQNTNQQVTISPIALTVTSTDAILRNWDTQPTYAIKLPDASPFVPVSAGDPGAIVSMKGAPITQTDYVAYTTDGSGTDVDGTTNGIVQKTTTIKATATGTLTVKAEYNVGSTGTPVEYLGMLLQEVNSAADLNITVSPATYEAGIAQNIDVTILGGDANGPDDTGDHDLLWAKAVVEAPCGQTFSTGNWVGGETMLGDAVRIDGDTVRFENVYPNDASGNVTVTVTGKLDTGASVGPIIKTIPVTGYVVTGITPSTNKEVDDTSSISLTVTTQAGVPVNNGKITITAPAAEGFLKNVDGVAGDDAFQTIVIDGATGEITYDAADPEPCSINGGLYEVTGITFAKVGDVVIQVESSTPAVKAKFGAAFTILGVNVYDFSYSPAALTAGVDATVLDITITEDSTPVTDVAKIYLNGTEHNVSAQTPTDGIYHIDPALFTEAQTLTVSAENADQTRYGESSIEVGMPTLVSDTTTMLTATETDITVNITDATGSPLNGRVWAGTYVDGVFTATANATVTDGIATLEDVTATTAGTLVWKTGSSDVPAEAVLLTSPEITVEVLYYSVVWSPLYPAVTEEITFTVKNNFGAVASNRDVKIVSPGGDLTAKVTTPAGVFKYTAIQEGDYYVSVKRDDLSWQDPVTVTVVISRVEELTSAPESVSLDADETAQLTVTVTYENDSSANVTGEANYTSNNESVATVSATGLITAMAAGETTISIIYTEGGLTVDTSVAVTVIAQSELEEISSEPDSATLNLSGTRQLVITAEYTDESVADVTAEATYESDNETVATVSAAGLVSALAEGEATITVTYTEGDITVTTEVTITVTELPTISLGLYSGANPILYSGATMALPDALNNISGTTEIIWQRDASTGGSWYYYIVSIGSGQVTQLENGTVYIVVVSEGCTWEIYQ